MKTIISRVQRLLTIIIVSVLFIALGPTTPVKAASVIFNVYTYVDAPVRGAYPSTTAFTMDEVNVVGVSWEPNDSPFQGGTMYSALVHVEAKEGYTFADTATFFINDLYADVVYKSTEEAKFMIYFPNTESDETFTLTTEVIGGHGQISGGRTNVAYGEYMTVNMWPEVGYQIDTLTVNGEQWIPYETISFNMYQNTHVAVTFAPIATYYNVSSYVPTGYGSILLESNYIESGTYTTIIFQPYDGYELDWVTVNGEYKGVMSNVLGVTITGDTYIEAGFKPIGTYYDVYSYVPGGNGSVLLESNSILGGTTTTVIFQPYDGYELDWVTVNGEYKGVMSNVLDITITAETYIEAAFKAVGYQITATVPTGHGKVIYTEGTQPAYTPNTVSFQADAGYELDRVLVNGVEWEVYGNVIDLVLTGNTTIEAYFKSNCCTLTTQMLTDGGHIEAYDGDYMYGAEAYYIFYPHEGYELDQVLVNDVAQAVYDNKLAITMTQNTVVKISFKKSLRFALKTQVQGGHGYISNGKDEVVPYTMEYITFYPDEGYAVDYVTVNGNVVNVTNNELNLYVDGDKTVVVTFKQIYTVVKYNLTTRVDGGHGTISSNRSGVIAGRTERVTFTPDEGYMIDTVRVNGVVTVIDGNTLDVVMNGNREVVVTYKLIDEPEATATPTATIAPNASPTATPTTTPAPQNHRSMFNVFIGIGVVGIIALLILLFFLLRRNKDEEE